MKSLQAASHTNETFQQFQPMNKQPAFPTQHANLTTGEHCGATLRDYSAVAAMAAMVSEGSYAESDTKLAQFSYEMADAMLKAREQ